MLCRLSGRENVNMDCNQVRGLLDERVEKLNKEQFFTIQRHAQECESCSQSYRIRLVAASLVEARAAEQIDPTPFFAARVMNALKEGRAAGRPPFLAAMWRQAGFVLASLVVLVVALASLTLYAGRTSSAIAANTQESAIGSYSPEQVVMGDAGSINDDSLTNSQVVDTVFNSGD